MAWWHFEINLEPTKAEKVARRAVLDRYGRYAFASAFVPILLVLLYRLAKRALALWQREQAYDAAPQWRSDYDAGDTRRKALAQAMVGSLEQLIRMPGLAFLTRAVDFLHLTKRFGIIGVSQLPIQHLLSLKTINPYAAAFRTSHEDLNRFHRVLGRLIFILLWLHLFDVFAGLSAFTLYHVLYGTSLTVVRQWSYRLFFITHLFVVFVTPGMIFIHATPTRPYILSSIVFFVVDLAVRRFATSLSSATVEIIQGTNLVKISATLPERKLKQLGERPGSHLVLVARLRQGPLTRRLLELGRGAHGETLASRIPLSIEGPYGTIAKKFPNLASGDVDKVLLVAGGVGATFAIPIYKALKAADASINVELVWAVRSASEVSWALAGSSNPSETVSSSRLLDDPSRPNLKQFVDEAFKGGNEDQRVAVLVCGPEEMGLRSGPGKSWLYLEYLDRESSHA
ncbi:unnamed protein product [Parascedosporium putredinis]|uniref:FAD-binding FR-type domain-containing protein n=1 Tax=Parascedosporium putredinis TaxID=1442378 RepID=A0A9P1H8P1_9PEZI|nr:unnamed protein product [Parascedosporium putredinis]CAI8000010.1 unnamed protein product [Parascedosporium putredinis]